MDQEGWASPIVASEAMDITPVILCGGSGERLWPVSRAAHPKHLSRLGGPLSLLEMTVQRLSVALPGQGAIVLCNESDRFQVAEQVVNHVGGTKPRILLEPERRDTCAAIALAVAAVCESDPERLLLVCPADHWSENGEAFADSVRRGAQAARLGYLVSFGVKPDAPHSGYGYLKTGAPIAGTEAFALERFVEKPPSDRAAAMLSEGGWLWNGGIFLFQAQAMRRNLERHAPEAWRAAYEAYDGAATDLDFVRVDRDAYRRAPKISIDYAVFEKADRLAVVPAAFDWVDIGSWSALQSRFARDSAGNSVHGRAVLIETENTFVHADGRAVVATLGVRDLIVAVTRDAVLVCEKSKSQDLKAVVATLRARGDVEADEQPLVFRPWGSYESLAAGARFQVKHIVVKPGGVLSLQRHLHRSEHWVVVRGTARVTLGDEQRLLTESESVYVPVGANHRLENPGRIDLELIEVQTGSYLGEDDIIRLEDMYRR
jgi:mannose-1-phosphate guanylyltransferase/mannose-6-phosphate isomerase